MGTLAYQVAFRKQMKTSYKGLNPKEKKYIKAKEKFEDMDKALNSFYAHCARTKTGAVDFENMSEEELNHFEYWNKEKEKAMRTMDNLENEIDVEYTLSVFLQINTHSVSF